MSWNRKTTARDRKRRARLEKRKRRQLERLLVEYSRLSSLPPLDFSWRPIGQGNWLIKPTGYSITY